MSELLVPNDTSPKNITKGWGIRGRLLAGFATITLLFVIAIAVNYMVVSNTKAFSTNVLKTDLPIFEDLDVLGTSLQTSSAAIRGYYITEDPIFKTEHSQSLTSILALITDLDAIIPKKDIEILTQWQKLKGLLQQYVYQQQTIVDEFATNKAAISSLITTKMHPLMMQISEILYGPISSAGKREGGLSTLIYNKLHQGTEKIIEDLNLIQTTEIAISIVGILVAILIAMFTARSIIWHIGVFREFSSRIAAGDLRQSLTVDGKDEMGQLGHDLNAMTQSLATVAKQINQACHNIVTSLEEVKQAVDTQSSGASEQASSINQITASLSEIEKSSAQTMEKAKTLGNAAEKTREKGQLGLEAVEQSMVGMKSIKEKVQTIAQTILDLSLQTQQVGEITSVVNNLAQQSKMLALNASIEAAKAGEAGKGFAVVANEVRNLAEQSEQSTTQVQKILEDIRLATEKAVIVMEDGTKGVDHGTGLVEETGEIVKNLTDHIHETSLASQQIEAAVKQESVGIEQITAGMNEINQVTSTFVASANQTLEAINNLTTIAKNLKEYADTYKV